MADSSTIVLGNNRDGDQIKIDLRVLEVILAIAADKVDGIAGMRGNIKSGLNWVLGRDSRGKGVNVTSVDGRLHADVYAYFKSGVNVPQVAVKVQKALKNQLKLMTDLDLVEVNIHVVGLVFPEKEENKAEQKLFPEDSEGEHESARKS